jgi:hypothetical protein
MTIEGWPGSHPHSQFDPEYGTPDTTAFGLGVTGVMFDMSGPLDPDAATDAASILISVQVRQEATNTLAVGQNNIAPGEPRWECPMTVVTGGFMPGPATGTVSTVTHYGTGVETYTWTQQFKFN